MNTKNELVPETSDRELVITRIFNAPRELVFRVWTDPRHVGQWWGPTGFTLTVYEMDVRPGGLWRFTMHGPDGVDYENKIVFTEVVPPERLAYAHNGAGECENESFRVTVAFDQQDSKTKLTMRMRFATAAERERQVREVGAIEGANQTLDRLQHVLTTME